jgi:hypothetical protein
LIDCLLSEKKSYYEEFGKEAQPFKKNMAMPDTFRVFLYLRFVFDVVWWMNTQEERL